MNKIYVLDTNVLLSDPNAIYSFEDNEVVIPSIVLQELDSKKKKMDETGYNARYVSRLLDKLRNENSLHNGVRLHNGGLLRVETAPMESGVYDVYIEDTADNAIIAVADMLQRENSFKKVILVSKDVLVRVKADRFVNAEDYLNDKVITANDESYTGILELEVDSELINYFYMNKKLKSPTEAIENQFVILKNGKQTAITKYRNGYLHPLYNYNEKDLVWGIQARNLEQKLALELLLDDDIPLVTITSKAGGGKTLLALAAALKKTQDENRYTKVIAGRPVIPMGRDIGFLPGEKEEKLMPYMQPIFDNLEFLFNCNNREELNQMLSGYEELIQIEALTYIRGRSIPNQFIIIDEAQNLTQHEVKTILTRVGENSKVVLLGDPEQIDHPYLDVYSNGLTYAIEKLKHLKESGHVTLKKGERSNLAQLCADIL